MVIRNQHKEKPYRIIRWSGIVEVRDGVKSNMMCYSGTLEDVQAFAQEMAQKAGVKVEAIL